LVPVFNFFGKLTSGTTSALMDLGVIEFPFASLGFAANVVKCLKREKGESAEFAPYPEAQAARRFLERPKRVPACLLIVNCSASNGA